MLLRGTLSLSPPVLVVSHRLPSVDGSMVRSRPWVPTKYCWTSVRVSPLITAR
ncbi:hypothetical protein [Actinoplanes sp. M2I2]|uniref:hypothetical protein n=1 Tax=Actinoplanes sp. M2I2 TaxID=1734444 RepID=UPI0020214A10|nr:hypothetical protein [Actinoplanes sp. M2I2]